MPASKAGGGGGGGGGDVGGVGGKNAGVEEVTEEKIQRFSSVRCPHLPQKFFAHLRSVVPDELNVLRKGGIEKPESLAQVVVKLDHVMTKIHECEIEVGAP